MGVWRKSSEALVDLFHEIMDQFEGADRKKMFGYPCCFCNGNMFTGLHEENWVLRLPEIKRNEMVSIYQAALFAPMKGRVMKEYLIIPQEILGDVSLLKKWIQYSLSYAQTLPKKEPKLKKKKINH